MGSRSSWSPHSQQPLHESAPTHVVLPSVAQLIASSSTPSTGSLPAYHHHQPSSSLPPIRGSMGSTPHSPPATASSANPPSPPEQLHQRHTSRASPTGSASSMSERSYHHQPAAQHQSSPGVTFHASHREADPHRPANARRQDSAISHGAHLIRHDMAKEASSSVRPSEADLSYSHRSPSSSHHSTTATHPGHVLPHSSAPAPAGISQEHVTSSLNPPPELSHSTQSPLQADPSPTSTARQPRFNVRFATNHTPENMPSVQRPRQPSPPPVTAPLPEPAEEAAPPKSEPSRPAVDRRIFSILMGHQTNHAEPSPETNDGPERCSGCNEAWKPIILDPRHLMEAQQLGDSSGPQQQQENFARRLEANREKLQQYDRENDEAFQQWKKMHSRCPNGAAKPTQNGHLPGPSNKRKPDSSHGDVSKRRAMPNGHATTAPPVQPSTST